MDYYTPPNGAERMLRSRIRRCYIALAELRPAIECLTTRIAHLNEDYVVENVKQMHKRYREAARALTDVANPREFNQEVGVQRAQERLLASPDAADDICRSIEYIQDGTKSVIRNIEYQLDAGYFDTTDDVYQTIQEQATMILGLVSIILDAIDSGFITDVNIYNETNN